MTTLRQSRVLVAGRLAVVAMVPLLLTVACGDGSAETSGGTEPTPATASSETTTMDGTETMGSMYMGDIDATPADEVPDAELVSGEFALLDTRPEGHDDTAGRAQLARHDGGTTVTVELTGLEPGESYIAHVHDAPCSEDAGGSHYKFDPDGPSVPPNEIHLAFDADTDGGGKMTAENADVVGCDAVSVVVHPRELTENRIVCADLS